MLVNTWHFSFTVSDIERSIPFYRDVLGLELVHTQEQSNAYTRKFVGYPDAHLKVAQFKIAGLPTARSGHVLELVEYVAPKGVKVDTRTLNPGTAHLAFQVADIHAEHARMRAWGCAFAASPWPSRRVSTAAASPATSSTPTISRWRLFRRRPSVTRNV